MDVIPESLQEIADGLGHAGGVFDKMISLLDSDETKPARELVNQIDRVRFLTAQLRQQLSAPERMGRKPSKNGSLLGVFSLRVAMPQGVSDYKI